jgi:glycerol-3-phosphate dehydrogenase subunit B
MTHEVVVVGAGLSGLVAAVRLAQEGRSVLVLAKGVGSTHLAPPTIDVLGYSPDGRRVESPAREVASLVDATPEHPYARVGAETVARALDWWRIELSELGFVGGMESNMLLPTAAGAVKPTALCPATMAGGDLRAGGRIAVVGLRGLKDFYPRLLVENLEHTARAAGVRVTVRPLELDLPLDGVRDPGTLGFAARFERADFRMAAVRQLETLLAPGERAGLPAVLGVRDGAHRELEERLGKRVFEIPTLPPSVPGIRLFEALKRALQRAGGRIVLGSPVVGAETNGRSVRAVVTATAARQVAYPARSFLLATGGFASGGLELDATWSVREPVFGLPVAGVPPPGEPRFRHGYFERHPLNAAGIEVDDRLRPAANGGPVYENLHAAGATLAGAEPWREASGNGIGLATGFAAAEAILESTA